MSCTFILLVRAALTPANESPLKRSSSSAEIKMAASAEVAPSMVSLDSVPAKPEQNPNLYNVWADAVPDMMTSVRARSIFPIFICVS